MAGRTPREWSLRAPDATLVRGICAETGLSPIASKILVNRGIADEREAGRFLYGTLKDLSSPFLMKDLEKASRRLVEAGARREAVLIYADYDADGATGAACLYLFLSEAFPGLPVRIHQNHRVADGYGLRPERLAAAAAEGVRLVVTVDCGISDGPAIREAGRLGMDVIVTDHHLPASELPPAFAVVNPKRPDCGFPEKELAGVGVAFMLACGVRKAMRRGDGERTAGEPVLRRYLDLVALGTVADMVPLRGDNRLLVKAGIEEMRANPRTGVAALLSVAGVAAETADEGDLGFRVGPRLNAAGRVGESRRSSDLLVTADRGEAQRLAAELNAENGRRQREEDRILRSAEEALRAGPAVEGLGAIVLADPGWHVGVLGIVASRIAERFFRPTVLLRLEGTEAVGSCRSVDGFPLVDALDTLAPLLSRYGGHRQAAGLALPAANLREFREGFGRIAAAYASPRGFVACIPVDARVSLADISTGFMEELERFRPFGMGNEEPVLLARNVRVARQAPFGAAGQHVKLEVHGDGRRFEVVAFHRPGVPQGPDGRIDLLFTPQRVFFRGNRSVRLLLRDVRRSEGPVL